MDLWLYSWAFAQMLSVEVRLEILEASCTAEVQLKDFAVVLDYPTEPLTFLISQSADLEVTYSRGSITVPTLQIDCKDFS